MKKSRIKFIALDIDGTIMGKEFRISDRTRKTIKRAIESGIYVVLATGRMYSATVPIASGLGIVTPLINYQGGLIREFYTSDEIFLHYTIKPDLAKAIINELRNFGAQISVYLDDELFVEDESHILREYAGRRHIAYHKVHSFDKVLDFKPTKILAIDSDPDNVTKMKNYLKEKYSKTLNVSKSMPGYCEIVDAKASKGDSILYLAKKWGIEKSEIMAIGDQDNDTEMLKAAGFSVAMGNADEELKKLAHYVTDTVENDGAALAIEKFVLEQDYESTI